jgi:hypothetical protein
VRVLAQMRWLHTCVPLHAFEVSWGPVGGSCRGVRWKAGDGGGVRWWVCGRYVLPASFEKAASDSLDRSMTSRSIASSSSPPEHLRQAAVHGQKQDPMGGSVGGYIHSVGGVGCVASPLVTHRARDTSNPCSQRTAVRARVAGMSIWSASTMGKTARAEDRTRDVSTRRASVCSSPEFDQTQDVSTATPARAYAPKFDRIGGVLKSRVRIASVADRGCVLHRRPCAER